MSRYFAPMFFVAAEPEVNPNADRSVSERGIRLIKRWEGLYLKAYYCPAKVLTIGYGHTNLSGVPPKVRPGMVLKDEAEADAILRDVLAKVYEPALRRHIKVPLSQHQWDAIVSWVYNLGETNLKKSTLLKRINQGRFDDVPAQMMRWNRADGKVYRGLTDRRRDECALWRGSGASEAPPRIDRDAPIVAETDRMPQGGFDAPQPEPVTDNDKWIERIGVLGPIVTSLVGAATDWRTAVAVCVTATVLVVYFSYRNRRED